MNTDWQKSSFCNGAAACAQVRQLESGDVQLRQSERPDVLVYTREEFAEFVAAAKAGEFDAYL